MMSGSRLEEGDFPLAAEAVGLRSLLSFLCFHRGISVYLLVLLVVES